MDSSNVKKFQRRVVKPLLSETESVPLMEKVWIFLFAMFIMFITKVNSFISDFKSNKQVRQEVFKPAIKVEENNICRYCCTKVENLFLYVSTCIHAGLKPVHTKCFKTFHDFNFTCNLCDVEKEKECICETPVECECKTEISESPLAESIDDLEVVGVKKEIHLIEDTDDIKEYLEQDQCSE